MQWRKAHLYEKKTETYPVGLMKRHTCKKVPVKIFPRTV